VNLERARKHVANLAHGLKTPLATLAVAIPKSSGNTSDLRDLIDVMERRIRHHLGRARAAALNGPVKAQSNLAGRIEDLILVLSKVNAEKGLGVGVDVPAHMAVGCEQQDLDEMLGNLLENAFQWARNRIEIRARQKDRQIVVEIDDDGPGLGHDQMSQVMQPGERLDETMPGFGFGLSITRELSELYGGELLLSKSPAGGLRASLWLPQTVHQ
jgi:signal transduction histidine kinase